MIIKRFPLFRENICFSLDLCSLFCYNINYISLLRRMIIILKKLSSLIYGFKHERVILLKNKNEIISELEEMKKENRRLSALETSCKVTDFSEYVKTINGLSIWTDAFRAALDHGGNILIPPSDEPYYIDQPLVIGSNTHIEASGALIKLTPDCYTLMLKTASAADGSHMPVTTKRAENISINGGRWVGGRSGRETYGISGRFNLDQSDKSFTGVYTLFFLCAVEHLTIENAVFENSPGFSVQIGEVSDAVFENIRFVNGGADGLHINGNTDRVLCHNISGQVGDDLVALNAYDWQDSSVNYGHINDVLCEGLELSPDSRYKAIRILPGRYFYDDGSVSECSITNVIFKNVSGIRTFKLYFQTPRYKLGESPEAGEIGFADNIFFEDIHIDLAEPIDMLPEYVNSDPLRGSIAAFELGSDIGRVTIESIDLTLHRDIYPYSYLTLIGPKSSISGDFEIFDPYISSKVSELRLSNIKINGESLTAPSEFCREIVFEDINHDGSSTGRGVFEKIILE